MMEKLHKRIYFDNPSDDYLEELYEQFDEVDFFYGNDYIRFQGNAERLQELYRYCRSLGLKVREKR